MSEPCGFCTDVATGPSAGTPWGICRACACSKCRGFRLVDDRGFLCTGQPFLTATNCVACDGEGTRLAETAGDTKGPAR